MPDILYSAAINSEDRLINAKEAIKGQKYYCPQCKTEMILRKSDRVTGLQRYHITGLPGYKVNDRIYDKSFCSTPRAGAEKKCVPRTSKLQRRSTTGYSAAKRYPRHIFLLTTPWIRELISLRPLRFLIFLFTFLIKQPSNCKLRAHSLSRFYREIPLK